LIDNNRPEKRNGRPFGLPFASAKMRSGCLEKQQDRHPVHFYVNPQHGFRSMLMGRARAVSLVVRHAPVYMKRLQCPEIELRLQPWCLRVVGLKDQQTMGTAHQERKNPS
jgi:hypothetical protein